MTAPQSGETAPRRRCASPARASSASTSSNASANRGNLGNTAKELGIERTNLYRKMKSLNRRVQASAVSVAF
jgi:transcriptional regulator of acetoin/glycerol metabolism